MTLAVHELPVVRRLFGDALEVVYARFWPGPDPLSPAGHLVDAVLATPTGGRVGLVAEVVPFKLTDWGFTVRDEAAPVAVRYPSTYAPAAPTVTEVTTERGGAVRTERYAQDYASGFRHEWRHVLAVARGEAAPRTSAADAVRDLDLAERITSAALAGRPAP